MKPVSMAHTQGLHGRLASIGGSHARVRIEADALACLFEGLAVGSLLQIRAARSFAVAVVTAIEECRERAGEVVADVDLLGEIALGRSGTWTFQRGISEYPPIRSAVELLHRDNLRLIYDVGAAETIEIGSLAQDPTIPAYVSLDEMLTKHFAVLGTTGVGKSTAVALVLREVLAARPQQRVLLVDPHNEYGTSFGERAKVLTPSTFRLPYWMFSFEEIVDAIFRGRPGVDEEVDILAEAIPEAKALFAEGRDQGTASLRRAEADGGGFTVDSPVPYRLTDLVGLIDRRMGKLESRALVPRFQRLIARIESLSNDPRYRFMFQGATSDGDTMAAILTNLFNLDGRAQITVVQLAGFPGEIVDTILSVLCRTAFELGLWSGGAVPLLVVCEEAHRYAPGDRTLGFGPTRKAVSRIAKEGRKFGVSLGLVTQRPADLDPTIVSQCSTIFAMRMANDRDQAIVRSAIPDAAAGLVASVSALGPREAIAFGEGVALPTRIRFGELAAPHLPRATTIAQASGEGLDRWAIAKAVERWRSAGMCRRFKGAFE
ncbi:ATP-binding protein [Salinarimonas sp.]|uniref:ATP-binding protein n=1 Tax=Salinarimonas sp. TaxID=2766526 RepID=UPI003919CE18